ncbi:hypothetical protein TIFTF001_046506 [Ficus carica]|uniref:Uncharacterized protein n=1 Tax=Ficus carica TaxID=3494 RepID=A0AA87ZRI2_FICCA|nr:hypothetical protein TIFTF001_046506 [Ficus carica]
MLHLGKFLSVMRTAIISTVQFLPQATEDDAKEKPSEEKHTPIVETPKEEPGWPSFGQLIIDLSKLGLEALGGLFLYYVPSRFRLNGARKGLTPLKDTLRMPEDEAGQPPLVQRQSAPIPLSETRQVHTPTASDKYSDMKPPKIKSSSLKDPIKLSSFRDISVSTKHWFSKRQEYAEFYGSGAQLWSGWGGQSIFNSNHSPTRPNAGRYDTGKLACHHNFHLLIP